MTANPTLAALTGSVRHTGGRPRRQAPRPRPEARPFDPRHPGRLASSHRRSLVLVLESFARQLATSFAPHLRTTVVVAIKSVEQRDYANLIASSNDPTWMAAISLGPVSGLGVIEVSVPLAMTLIERLLGGSGFGPHPQRSLTDLESGLLSTLIEIALTDLTTALAPLCAIKPDIVRIESQAELLKAAPQSEAYAVTVLSVELPETATAPKKLVVALPLAGLAPAFETFAGGSHRIGQLDIQPATVADHLLDAPVEIVLRFEPVGIRAEEFLQLEEGQILPLAHRTSVPLALDVEGMSLLSARPGRLGRRLACVIVDPTTDPGAPTS